MVGIANMVDLILYAITVGKITVSSVGTVLYLSPPKLQTRSLIWLDRGVTFMQARNGGIHRWPTISRPSVDVGPSMDNLDPPLAPNTSEASSNKRYN